MSKLLDGLYMYLQYFLIAVSLFKLRLLIVLTVYRIIKTWSYFWLVSKNIMNNRTICRSGIAIHVLFWTTSFFASCRNHSLRMCRVLLSSSIFSGCQDLADLEEQRRAFQPRSLALNKNKLKLIFLLPQKQ